MALTVDVPAHITTEQRAEACKALGLDPAAVQAVSFDADDYVVKVTVFVPSLSPVAAGGATVQVAIPVIWTPESSDSTSESGPF